MHWLARKARAKVQNRQGTNVDLFGQRVEVSETTEREIDVAVWHIITKAFEQATAGHLLLARKTLTADQFPAIRSAARQPETVG